jgi:hypothetical protein
MGWQAGARLTDIANKMAVEGTEQRIIGQCGHFNLRGNFIHGYSTAFLNFMGEKAHIIINEIQVKFDLNLKHEMFI